ncbi:hypothetical protein GCM10007096_20320 [Pullulanibacillus pueri]|uniref:Uncharacterized protein n=1 Tax=Pullulanibacillus pueri TaxID=1437324 RepID=A0A8J2ZW49_9BACL|nr:hypothetical protein GCM10007096_20320 [Pullulanibacillus pueri]
MIGTEGARFGILKYSVFLSAADSRVPKLESFGNGASVTSRVNFEVFRERLTTKRYE